jgi:hypothetical protein
MTSVCDVTTSSRKGAPLRVCAVHCKVRWRICLAFSFLKSRISEFDRNMNVGRPRRVRNKLLSFKKGLQCVDYWHILKICTRFPYLFYYKFQSSYLYKPEFYGLYSYKPILLRHRVDAARVQFSTGNYHFFQNSAHEHSSRNYSKS